MIAWLRPLPRVALSRAFGRFTRLERPRWLASASIHLFLRLYPRIDLAEARRDRPQDYRSLLDFFTRGLKPEARPLADSLLVSPCDGAFGQSGPIEAGLVLQAKGVPYRLADLLEDPELAASFEGGAFATIYLAPFNYHRVHHPVGGHLRRGRHIAGDLWPVNRAAVSGIPGLFVRNERSWVEIEAPAGRAVVVLVGALNVGSIVIPARPEAERKAPGPWSPEAAPEVAPGDELGIFETGSTVILLVDSSLRGAGLGVAFPTPGEEVRMGAGLAFPR